MENYGPEIKTIEQLQNEILRVRLTDLEEEKRLCFSLSEKAIDVNDTYALMFSYTFLGDYYLAINDNQQGYYFYMKLNVLENSFSIMIFLSEYTITLECFIVPYMMKLQQLIII